MSRYRPCHMKRRGSKPCRFTTKTSCWSCRPNIRERGGRAQRRKPVVTERRTLFSRSSGRGVRAFRASDDGKQGNSLETLRSMVASGLGITVLPASALTNKYQTVLVKAVPFSAPVPRRRVVLATRSGFYRPRAVALLAQVLRTLDLPISPLRIAQ